MYIEQVKIIYDLMSKKESCEKQTLTPPKEAWNSKMDGTKIDAV
jgi:hypothetical protein